MSHGFSRILTDHLFGSGVNSILMDASPCKLKYSELTDSIIKGFYDVYNELGLRIP